MMTEILVERAARAMDPNAWGNLSGGAKERGFERPADVGRRRRSLAQAHAAIASLREPTKEMLYECGNIPNPEYGRIIMPAKNIRALWYAMIDTALGIPITEADHPLPPSAHLER